MHEPASLLEIEHDQLDPKKYYGSTIESLEHLIIEKGTLLNKDAII